MEPQALITAPWAAFHVFQQRAADRRSEKGQMGNYEPNWNAVPITAQVEMSAFMHREVADSNKQLPIDLILLFLPSHITN